MTLIAAFASPSAGLFALSDIIVSSAEAVAEAPAFRLPMRIDGVPHRPNTKALIGLSQKTVIITRTLVQWSGYEDLARILIGIIANISQNGENFVSFAQVKTASGWTDELLSRVKLIYHYNSGPGTIQKWHWGCLVEQHGDAEMFIQGSGSAPYYFAVDVVSPNGVEGPEAVISAAMARVMHQYASEARNNDRFYDYYGGWIELSTKSENGFLKQPYAVKIWTKDSSGKIEYFEPLIFSYYVGHHLVIARLDWLPVDGRIVAHPEIFLVRDFLQRDIQHAIEEFRPQYEPLMVIHLMIDDVQREVRQIAMFNYEGDVGLNMKIHHENGVDITLSERLRKWLEEGASNSFWSSIDYNDDPNS